LGNGQKLGLAGTLALPGLSFQTGF
jgi:hypothetical protein